MDTHGNARHDFALDQGQEPGDLTVLGKSPEGDDAGYYQQDRALHTHIVGQSGGGKSTLLESIALQDMRAGRGGLFLDPHGDSAERLAAAAPSDAVREGRVVYLDFGAEQDALVALNPFEVEDVTSEWSRQTAVDTATDLLRRVAGIDESGVRLMKYISKGLQTLAFVPEAEGSARGGATLLDLMPLFTDSPFRDYARGHTTDRTLQSWWSVVFEGMSSSKAVGETMSLENRLAPILNDPRLAAVLGGARSTLDLAEAMDEGAYVIVNLAKGRNSEAFRRMVGSTVVNQVFRAALGRQQRMVEADRRRFHLILDEFHNFLTKDFCPVLEEARKYGLDITVAHQTLGQLEDYPEVACSLGNNVQNRIAYGVGPGDAAHLAKFMAPLTPTELCDLPRYRIAVKLRQAGERGLPATTLVTLPPKGTPDEDNGLAPLRPGTPTAGLQESCRSAEGASTQGGDEHVTVV